MEKYWEKLNQCIDNEGRHLSDVVFKFLNCIMYTIQDLKKKSIVLGFVFISFPNCGVLSAAPCTEVPAIIELVVQLTEAKQNISRL
jgi:hypothetical protein